MVTARVEQGEIWLADLAEPVGSVAGYTRPVVIVQGDEVNSSRISTFLAIPLTASLHRQMMPTNLLMMAGETGLDRDSVAQPTLLQAVDLSQLIKPLGRINRRLLEKLFVRLDTVLGRPI
jgi:mRNA interferase MazF